MPVRGVNAFREGIRLVRMERGFVGEHRMLLDSSRLPRPLEVGNCWA